MKITTMILAGAVVWGGVALAKRMSAEDKKKLKNMVRNKLGNKLPAFLQNRLSMSN